MIPLRKENTLTQHGTVLSSNKMTISPTAEMFDLLSSGLYKNPIKAVVREYLANAVDESNTVDVTVPTSLVPYFKVRDHGKGMSEDFVLNRFSRYGDTSKGDDPNKIGGFGVGCKSGYSYTDSFTVRSWYEGTVSTYECTKDVKGTFSISLRGRRQSDEDAGVEIIIPVKMGDFKAFEKEIFYYTSYLHTFRGTEFTGVGPYLNIKHVRGNLYSTQTTDTPYWDPRTYLIVVMGGIPYDCSTEGIIGRKEEGILESGTYIINQPIGSLTITASRESIRYSPETVATLKPVIEEAVSDLIKEHTEGYNKCTTTYEKIEYYTTLPSSIKAFLIAPDFELKEINSRIKVNKSGAVSEDNYRWHRYSYNAVFYGLPCDVILIDTDKFVPSRIKAYWEQHPGVKTVYFKPLTDLSLAEAELKGHGIPYKLLSSFTPLKKPRSSRGTVNTSPKITKNEALVVYYKGSTFYSDGYSREETLDLDNAKDVCYYNRSTEKEYESYIDKYSITKGYSVVSATSKNISKLEASNIKHIKEVVDEWVKSGALDHKYYYHSWLNVNKSSIPLELKYLGMLNYNGYFKAAYDWISLPAFIRDNIDTSKAEDYYKDLLKKVDYINSLTVKGYDGKTIHLKDHLNWYTFIDEATL